MQLVGAGSAGGTDEGERAERQLAAIVESSADAIIAKTLDGTITSWNTGAERLYGWTAAEVVGRPISILVPPDSVDELPTIFARLHAGRDVPTYETRRVHKDGHIVNVSLTVSPIFDAGGQVIGASAIARDIGDARRQAARTARLLEVTAGLAGALTVDAVVRTSTELAVRATNADGAVFVLADHDARRARLLGTAGYDQAFISAWDAWPLDEAMPVNDAIREGRLLVFESVDPLLEHYEGISTMLLADTAAIVAIPLATDGPPQGALGLRFRSPRRFTAADRDELRNLGGQCAIALERARLFESEREARERVTFLSQAGEALAGSLDVDTLLSMTAELAVPRLADWCGISIVQDDGSVRRFGFHHVDDAVVERGREWWEHTPLPLDRDRGAPRVIRTGEPEMTPIIPPEGLEAFSDPAEHEVLRALGVVSSIVVPLIARGRTLGAMTLVMGPSGRHYTPTELELAQDLARRAALAADNARLFAERAHVARRLQASLLPPSLPPVPGVSLGARYLAAGEGTEVGGDFYDVFPLLSATWGLVIGDVCGQGADAAGVTALARYTVRALAPHARRPSEVLAEVNDALVRQAATDERFLTAAYGVLARDVGASSGAAARITLSLAGHPPPFVVRAGGGVTRAGTPGTLLGVFAAVSLSDAVVELFPGDSLVLFTDGVTEAHGAGGQFGDDRLAEVLAAVADRSADGIAEAVAEAVAAHRGGAAGEDDMAVFVVQIAR